MTGEGIFTPEYYRRLRELEGDSWWNAGMRDAAAKLLGSVSLPDTGHVLDVGCGSGQTLGWFLESHGSWTAFGVDIAPEGLQAGRSLGPAGLARASALALPSQAEAVDLVISLDVLQHLPLGGGDEVALKEMYRVLRPGAFALLRSNAQSLPRTEDDPEFDFHKYGSADLRRKLESTGFAVLKLGRLNALLGLAEIPRELRADRHRGRGYHGVLAVNRSKLSWPNRAKRRWLGIETRMLLAGVSLPLGRTHLALCQKPPVSP